MIWTDAGECGHVLEGSLPVAQVVHTHWECSVERRDGNAPCGNRLDDPSSGLMGGLLGDLTSGPWDLWDARLFAQVALLVEAVHQA